MPELSKIPTLSLDSLSYALTPKENPKDLVEVIIGDDKDATQFYPQIKIQRWQNETNFSARLITDDVADEVVTQLDEKITWEKGNISADFYDLPISAENPEGGMEFEVILKEKPKTNVVQFTLQDKGLEYFYQPALTQEEIDQGASRPENVVGSYAVYHKTKGGMNEATGMEYKAGKAFHIYRPHVIDSLGNETWGVLEIDEVNGILRISVDQTWLNSANYPVIVDPTIGNTTLGASNTSLLATRTVGVGPYTAAGNGTVTSMTFYVENGTQIGNVKGFITGTDEVIIANGVSSAKAVEADTNTVTFETNPSIVSGTGYEFWVVGDSSSPDYYYDNAGAGGFIDATNSYTTPTNPTDAGTSNRHTIYATYTESGGGAAPVLRTRTRNLMGLGT